MMRTSKQRSLQMLAGAALVLNLLCVMYLAVKQHQNMADGSDISSQEAHQPKSPSLTKETGTVNGLADSITIILRDFEDFDNAVVGTVSHMQRVLKNVKILIVGDTLPYPPLVLNKTWKTDVISLQTNLLHNYSSSRPDHLINTKYVLLLPDGAVFEHWKHIQAAANLLGGKGQTRAVAVGVGSEPLQCLSLDVDLKRWQITTWIRIGSNSLHFCDMFAGDHALLLYTSDFHSLAEPFARPVNPCFYVQAKLREWKIRYLKQYQLARIKTLFIEPHNKWKHKRAVEERVASFYRSSHIKLVTASGHLNYFGCTKNTQRCFGTIIDDMPEYLYQGKWTPPCCLRALRETAKHVFGILEKEGVRYWLEGGSLLGAARSQDIIPWDYDVDIGMYREDVEKSSYLKDTLNGSYVDEEGFVWEKAQEGEFFRVQYSEVNHLHVDIHPFYSRNGTMTKNTWFSSHRQDTEFPEHFLKPLTKIKFAGIIANAPNNVKQFLEFKFGVGVIAEPRFPNFQQAQ